MLSKVLRKRDAAAEFFDVTEPRAEAVDTGGRGPQAEHEACAGGIAQRRLRMGVRESGSPRRQTADMRGMHLRMAAERFDPVVEVIDCDEEDVGSYGFCSGFRARCKGYRNERRKEKEGPSSGETLLHGCQDSTVNVRGCSRAEWSGEASLIKQRPQRLHDPRGNWLTLL